MTRLFAPQSSNRRVTRRQLAACASIAGLLLAQCDKGRGSEATSTAPPPSGAANSAVKLVTLPPGMGATTGPQLLNYVRQKAGKGTLVNVWASWCGSCQEEMPMLVKLEAEYAAKGLSVVFVSVDAPQDASKALAFLKSQSVPLPSLIAAGPLGPFKKTLSPKWKGSLPATFLFDSQGELKYVWGAQVFESELRPLLDGFLRGEHIDGAANFMIRRGASSP